ncbi:class D sortase [Lentibacillus sp. CBA3610]|uniref:class D sortase n=1 Tax=Lentibacillus sp. CBA3610 TaxID=2518176 RepID=UPI001595F795|nr:class D sortase [Lentibacillus sp. CBA3610]QKY68758.1 class D sortase [Lentibacillus sp. CBA3610]
MKKLGIVLMVTGAIMVGWFGYQHWSGMQSVSELDGNVVKTPVSNDENNSHEEDKSSEADQTWNTQYIAQASYHDGDEIAKLVMPSIDLSFDVFWGTGDEALAKGVGMYDSQLTTTPDMGGHTVLSGHRDSVFQPVGDLEDGDSLYVRYGDQDYEYRVNKTWITEAEDRSVIVEKDDPTLTLSTCYPFQFIGSAPDRYIVEAEFIQKGDLLDLD